MWTLPRSIACGLVLTMCGCATAPPPASSPPPSEPSQDAVLATGDPIARILAETRRVHGGQGPWAVAGYRMGAHAMASLGIPRGHMGLRVHHHSPSEVQYSCITDGLQAATGASLGKHTLDWTEVPLESLRSEVGTSAGDRLVYTLTPSFIERYSNVPFDQLDARGAEVAALDDEAIFEVREVAGTP